MTQRLPAAPGSLLLIPALSQLVRSCSLVGNGWLARRARMYSAGRAGRQISIQEWSSVAIVSASHPASVSGRRTKSRRRSFTPWVQFTRALTCRAIPIDRCV
ncbi:hypothetical protein [Streptomyces sp. NBC_01727]|uniref:hypothetical protein n=1 Tax=Streptomyces sp. NBC_01727 TaxID=2975924 RepID=UPI002E0DF337|nr:hypothetical protein OIE76_42780 [Streptomyces sp. NBC_01727]